jgi:AraC-like DNA-binding protein
MPDKPNTQITLHPLDGWTAPAGTWRFLTVQQGDIRCTSTDPHLALTTRDCLALHPDTICQLHTASTQPATIQLCSFDPQIISPTLTLEEQELIHAFRREHHGVCHFPDGQPDTQQIAELLHSSASTHSLPQRGCALMLLGILLSHESFDPARSLAETRLRHALNTLPHDRIRSLTATELAHLAQCTRRHLTRLVQHLFGCSFAQLKMQLRLEKAAMLLTTTDLKISHISRKCGFTQTSVFCSYFKRHYQKTPTQWRDSA